MANPARRRAFYQWLRGQGYSASEARRIRQRPDEVWRIVRRTENDARRSSRPVPRAPTWKQDKQEKTSIRRRARRAGLSAEQARRVGNMSPTKQQQRLSAVEKTAITISQRTGERPEDVRNRIQLHLIGASTMRQMYQAIEDEYEAEEEEEEFDLSFEDIPDEFAEGEF